MLKGVSAGGREVYFARPRVHLSDCRMELDNPRVDTRSHGCK